jgi:hypothetical protein
MRIGGIRIYNSPSLRNRPINRNVLQRIVHSFVDLEAAVSKRRLGPASAVCVGRKSTNS